MGAKPPRLPLQAKRPFRLDPDPGRDGQRRAGPLCASRALRRLQSRRRGLEESQWIEVLLLLQIAGGDCPEDIGLLQQDAGQERRLRTCAGVNETLGSNWGDSR